MSMTYYDWLTTPSPQAARETAENNFLWGRPGQARMSYGVIVGGAARDTGNTGTGGATTILRAGLAMGVKTSDSKYYQYDHTATDGTQYLAGYLAFPMKMIDGDGTSVDRTGAVIIGGQVKSGNVYQGVNLNSYGITNGLRAASAARFIFDDDLTNARRQHPWRQEVAKATAYTVLAADCGVLFDNTGASASVTFTLPALSTSYGLWYGFLVVADFNLVVASAEGTNIIAQGNVSASSVTFGTAGQKIGGILKFYANPGATKWIAEVDSNNPITVA